MIFNFIEVKCIFEVLEILNKNDSKYSIMFKETKVSHTTLQSTLKKLINKKFIKKYDIGHQNVDYKITEKGKILLKSLIQLQEILK